MFRMDTTTTVDQAVGRKLKGMRVEAGLSQEELAERSGVSESTVYRIERGERSARMDQLDALCGVLGIEIYDFMKAALSEPPRA